MKNNSDYTTCDETIIVCDWDDCPHSGNCDRPCTITTKRIADQINNLL